MGLSIYSLPSLLPHWFVEPLIGTALYPEIYIGLACGTADVWKLFGSYISIGPKQCRFTDPDDAENEGATMDYG
ncbi:hypothetical protein M0802_011827 [Mischocyttarus mexicanus]|nr:hypothetical protein M0802_011834 [Mischocyttarus mexicanus]KAI4487788.1 hypothetical protein M0802_011827 [Mischocyttarus mexicanus]